MAQANSRFPSASLRAGSHRLRRFGMTSLRKDLQSQPIPDRFFHLAERFWQPTLVTQHYHGMHVLRGLGRKLVIEDEIVNSRTCRNVGLNLPLDNLAAIVN